MVANGQLEVPIGTVLLKFERADFMLKENFVIMKTTKPANRIVFSSQN